MKKTMIYILLCLALIGGYFIYSTYRYVDALSLVYNWDIEIPKYKEATCIIEKPPSFLGDGEALTKFQYKNDIDWSNLQLKKLEGSATDYANHHIQHFTTTALLLRSDKEKIEKAFQTYNVVPEDGDFYRYVTDESDPRDYLILLYKPKEKALYVYESYM